MFAPFLPCFCIICIIHYNTNNTFVNKFGLICSCLCKKDCRANGIARQSRLLSLLSFYTSAVNFLKKHSVQCTERIMKNPVKYSPRKS